MAFNQSCYGIRGVKGVSNTSYIYYALKNAINQILQVSYGGVFNTITRETFQIIQTRLPDLYEQEAIACILGALDDKIELNRQMCKTLEDTAQAIFKSWFVDFDPVHAKATGKQPEGLNPAIAALFPDSFEDSDVGKIPKGWKVSTLDDVITRIPVGKKYEQKTANSKGQVPILDQGQSGIIGYHDNEPGVIASKDKPIIVFANHTCYMRLIYYPFSAIQNVLPFVGNGINTIWLHYATLGKQTFTEYKGHWPDLIRQQICVPNMRLDDRFSDTVTPILWKMWCCLEENDTLGSIRDSLLPRLISGELKVKDAEKIASRFV
jgi:type I restriction enzyme S subunit